MPKVEPVFCKSPLALDTR